MISVAKPEDIVRGIYQTPSYEEQLERFIRIIDGRLRNLAVCEDGYVRIVCDNDFLKFANDIKRIYLAAGWSKVKVSFKDNGWREPNPVTTIVLHK